MSRSREVRRRNLTTDLRHALAHAKQHGGWSVALCPTAERAGEVAEILAALVGDVPFSGRTAKLDFGTVSIAAASDPVFVPDTEPFFLYYLGWDGQSADSNIAVWEKKSAGIVSLGVHT